MTLLDRSNGSRLKDSWLHWAPQPFKAWVVRSRPATVRLAPREDQPPGTPIRAAALVSAWR